MTTVFGSDSAQLTALQAVMTRAEQLERDARRIEAERLRAFADAVEVALAEVADLRGSRAPACGSRDDRGERAREVARSELAYRAVRAELAAVFRLSEATVERKMDHAYRLAHHYSRVFDALLDGRIGEQHTRVVVEAGLVIGGDSFESAERRAAYARAVLPFACEETPNRLRPIAKRLAERFAEIPLDERHEQAKSRRRVFVVDGDDGMSDLVAHLPAVEAHAIHERLTGMARELEREEPAEDRGAATSMNAVPAPVRRRRDEIRADLLSDLLLSNTPATVSAVGGASAGLGGVRARVQVIVTDESLFADDAGAAAPPDAAAELAGVGPIDAATARRLAGGADVWGLIRHDLATGAVVSVDRYRPSARMRRLLGVRDEHCRFLGCRAPLWRCDLDHTVDAAKGGATATDNLAHLCRGHHMLKHHGGWQARQEPGGVLRWLSPSGRVYRDRPASRVRFASARAPVFTGERRRE